MTMKLAYTLIAVLVGIVAVLTTVIVVDYIQYQEMLAFERELDEAVRRTKAIYGGN